MIIIVKDGQREVRRAAADAWDRAQGSDLKEAARLLRVALRDLRFAQAAGREDLVERNLEMARAIRRSMEKRING